MTKVIYSKYSKHWLLSTVAHTIDCVWIIIIKSWFMVYYFNFSSFLDEKKF